MYPHLFSEFTLGNLKLKNRLTMAPLYLGYAGMGGTVSAMLLEHYVLMAKSGVALVVVENATVDHPLGSGSDRTIRADTEENFNGLEKLARTIQEQGALASLQINHAGRFAGVPEPVAPSAVETFGRLPRALTANPIQAIQGQYADAAARAKRAGFDMVELHGGTGYLLAQFLSPRTNKRKDEYGGDLENRIRFVLEVVDAVREAVGDFPVGYRFMADEWLPDGLQLAESVEVAKALAHRKLAYLSVMGGTYESFFLPDIVKRSKKQGYMLDLAAAVKQAVDIPVISAGRFATGQVAEQAVADGNTDLIGLARVLWADPEWPKKVREGKEDQIIHCDPECEDACIQMVMRKKPAFCVNWPPEKMKEWKAKVK